MTWFGPTEIPVTRTLKNGQEVIDFQALDYLRWQAETEKKPTEPDDARHPD